MAVTREDLTPQHDTPSCTGYDPRHQGARCDICPLRAFQRAQWKPIPDERHPGARFYIAGEAPGEMEILTGKPFNGKSGRFLEGLLRLNGLRRQDVHLGNVLACRPPMNELDRVLTIIRRVNAQIRRDNKARKDEWTDANKKRIAAGIGIPAAPPTVPLVPTPMSCCFPRFRHAIKEENNLFLVGATAARAVLMGEDLEREVNPDIPMKVKGEGRISISIHDIRGVTQELELPYPEYRQFGQPVPYKKFKLVASLHPAGVLRARRWTAVLAADIGKAMRYYTDTLRWNDAQMRGKIYYHPKPAALEKFLFYSGAPWFAYDTETDAKESLLANLRCFQITRGDTYDTVVVGLRGINGTRVFYNESDQVAVTRLVTQFMVAPQIRKFGWNNRVYDEIVIRRNLGVAGVNTHDGLMWHHARWPDLPHSLAFVASVYTDAPPWKTDRKGRKLATGAETDEQLHEYGGLDTIGTALVAVPIVKEATEAGLAPQMELQYDLQDWCLGMHVNGMQVNQDARQELDVKTRKEALHYRKQLVDRLHSAGVLPLSMDFNPNAPLQVAAMMYEKMGLEAVKMTDSGDPSVDDDCLRAYYIQPHIPAWIKEWIGDLRRYRSRVKLRGTYLLKFKPCTLEIGFDPDAFDAEAESSMYMDYKGWESAVKSEGKKRGVVLWDGRVHPSFHAHGTSNRRLASSDPNMQNCPNKIKYIFVPGVGMVFVGADADQLELRGAVNRWKIKSYMEAFARGADPHAVTAFLVYGEEFRRANGFPGGHWDGNLFIPNGEGKWHGDAKKMRTVAKQVCYASQYGAEPETVWRVVTSTENDDGELIFAHYKLDDIIKMHGAFLDGAPEFRQGWEWEMNTWRQQGYIAESIFGWRRYFLDGEKLNDMVNAPIQSEGAALIHRGTRKVISQIPFRGEFGPGLVNQCHDSLTLEVKIDYAERARAILQDGMNQRVEGYPVPFTGKAVIGDNWNEV